jgi:hypothetical protein
MILLRDDEKTDHPDSNGFIQIQTLSTYKVFESNPNKPNKIRILLDS